MEVIFALSITALTITCVTVYTQRLTELMQVVAGPMIQVLEEEMELNTRMLAELKEEKKQLISTLNAAELQHTRH